MYFKKHLPPVELNTLELDSDYTFEFSEPYVLEIDGLRYGFLTCYDFYFYEAFANIARQKVDIIIGCSLQRSDSHDAIETMCRFLAYNTNAYVIRSSVSFSEDSDICGASMVVSPYGRVHENMKGKFGMATVEFDPKDKYYKPAGFKNPDAPHYEYIEFGRKPWQYRLAGSSCVNGDREMKYPRICASKGFNTVAPESSMSAFGAAIASGADEIEFNIWPTKDKEIVCWCDKNLDKVSLGSGLITDLTIKELELFDFGGWFSEKYRGQKIVKLEDILKKFSGQVVMNIHIKPLSRAEEYPKDVIQRILGLVKKYDCEKYVYFTLESDVQIRQFKSLSPKIQVCVASLSDSPSETIDRAISLGCEKALLKKDGLSQEVIDKAHKNGIICNLCSVDDPKEARKFSEMGIDTILTNDYNLIAQELK